jgi:endonuclease/exonuclease/phosphatase family metal-dependent hydrolase
VLIFLALVLVTTPLHPLLAAPHTIKIAAFNANILGKAKMANPAVAQHLVEIITRYEVILIQEIRDIYGDTPQQLLNLVNAQHKGTYALTASKPLGRSSSKEQYVYYYREDAGIRVQDAQVYQNTDNLFERAPYLVKFSQGSYEFSLIGLHAKPNDAVSELNQLLEVYRFVDEHFPGNDAIILGDLNVDCTYVSDHEYENLDLRTEGFTFNIAKHLDTTVGPSVCAYDNIVSKSDKVKHAGIFNFKSAFGLSQFDAEAVSDHFPVEFELTVSEQ